MLSPLKSLSLSPLVLVPGWTYLRSRGIIWGLGVSAVGLLIISLFAITRWITNPNLFILMNGLLVAWHLTTMCHGLALKKQSDDNTAWPMTLKTVCLIGLCGTLIVANHLNKATLFGFDLFHVPSKSMTPALVPGDIILVDTWKGINTIEPGDIVVFKRTERGIVLVKRLDQLRQSGASTEMYLLGDNARQSIDSRRFGWVATDHLIGKHQGVVVNIR